MLYDIELEYVSEEKKALKGLFEPVEPSKNKILTSDGIYVNADQLEEYNRQKKLQKDEERRRLNEELKKRAAMRDCPFKAARQAADVICDALCAFHDGTACRFANTKTAAVDTKGRKCPVSGRQCLERCSLYFQGCTL